MKQPRRPHLAFAAVFLAVAVTVAAAACATAGGPRRATASTQAPDFTVPLLDGGTTRLADYRGRRLLLHFWASWCGPCVFEMPRLDAARERLRERGYDVLAVSLDESPESARALRDRIGISLAVAVDADGAVADAYGVDYIPMTVVVDEEGRIAGVLPGVQEWDGTTPLPGGGEPVDRKVL